MDDTTPLVVGAVTAPVERVGRCRVVAHRRGGGIAVAAAAATLVLVGPHGLPDDGGPGGVPRVRGLPRPAPVVSAAPGPGGRPTSGERPGPSSAWTCPPPAGREQPHADGGHQQRRGRDDDRGVARRLRAGPTAHRPGGPAPPRFPAGSRACPVSTNLAPGRCSDLRGVNFSEMGWQPVVSPNLAPAEASSGPTAATGPPSKLCPIAPQHRADQQGLVTGEAAPPGGGHFGATRGQVLAAPGRDHRLQAGSSAKL